MNEIIKANKNQREESNCILTNDPNLLKDVHFEMKTIMKDNEIIMKLMKNNFNIFSESMGIPTRIHRSAIQMNDNNNKIMANEAKSYTQSLVNGVN